MFRIFITCAFIYFTNKIIESKYFLLIILKLYKIHHTIYFYKNIDQCKDFQFSIIHDILL